MSVLCLPATVLLLAVCSGEQSALHHFVFVGRDRQCIRDPEFLATKVIAGAQLKYTWKELEPERDRYALEPMLDDSAFLSQQGKKLWVQIQDVSFDKDAVPVPNYLRSDPAFCGGVAEKFESPDDDVAHEHSDGWVVRRWVPAAQEHFRKRLAAIAGRLDGGIEGINPPETAIGFGKKRAHQPDGFTPDAYAKAVQCTMSAACAVFQKSPVVQYANFMPGEWQPSDDKGYLQSVYDHAAKIGVGVGEPDLLPPRKGQQNHCLWSIAGRKAGVITALAVQDGNFDELNPKTKQRVTAVELYRYAKDELLLDILFWGTQ